MKDNNNYWLNKWKKQRCNEVFESSFMNITAGVCALPGASHVILNVPYHILAMVVRIRKPQVV